MELFNYLLKVSACSALFFAFYLLVLKRLTFFKINRFYLLFSLLTSFIIPALQFSIERESLPSSSVLVNTGLQTEAFYLGNGNANAIQAVDTSNFNWLSVLPIMYALIVFGLFCLTVWRLVQLFKEAKLSSIKINGLKIVPKASGFTNCSFFNYVFIDENSLTEAELNILLRHEEVHANQYHSIDKLFLMLVKTVLWFNPIVYLFDKELEQAHEFEADEIASKNIGIEQYANLLLNLAVSKSEMPLVHNFVKSPLKQRVKMLFHAKSNGMKKLAYLVMLPIGLCLIWSFTIKIVDAEPANKVTLKTLIQKSNLTSILKASKTLENNKLNINDTLRLVGSNSLGKNPKVVIDGKLYKADILTKLSPNSVRSTYTYGDSIDIKTRNNEIEYATPIEIADVKIRNSIDNRPLYSRYIQHNGDVSEYDEIRTNQPHGYTIYRVAKGTRVAIFIYGKQYTEAEAMLLKPDLLANHKGMSFFRKGEEDFAKLIPQNMNDYDAVLNILGNPTN